MKLQRIFTFTLVALVSCLSYETSRAGSLDPTGADYYVITPEEGFSEDIASLIGISRKSRIVLADYLDYLMEKGLSQPEATALATAESWKRKKLPRSRFFSEFEIDAVELRNTNAYSLLQNRLELWSAELPFLKESVANALATNLELKATGRILPNIKPELNGNTPSLHRRPLTLFIPVIGPTIEVHAWECADDLTKAGTILMEFFRYIQRNSGLNFTHKDVSRATAMIMLEAPTQHVHNHFPETLLKIFAGVDLNNANEKHESSLWLGTFAGHAVGAGLSLNPLDFASRRLISQNILNHARTSLKRQEIYRSVDLTSALYSTGILAEAKKISKIFENKLLLLGEEDKKALNSILSDLEKCRSTLETTGDFVSVFSFNCANFLRQTVDNLLQSPLSFNDEETLELVKYSGAYNLDGEMMRWGESSYFSAAFQHVFSSDVDTPSIRLYLRKVYYDMYRMELSRAHQGQSPDMTETTLEKMRNLPPIWSFRTSVSKARTPAQWVDLEPMTKFLKSLMKAHLDANLGPVYMSTELFEKDPQFEGQIVLE